MTKRFVVDRSRWIRGNSESSKLLRESDGHMCCLGFVCTQLGVPRELLREVGGPAGVDHHALDDFLTNGTGGSRWNSPFANSAIGYNDSMAMEDSERERLLSELFEPHGGMEFVDGEQKPSRLRKWILRS